MILLPCFSSATLTATSNPKKRQGLPQNGFLETCIWGTSRSSFSVIPEEIAQDPQRGHTLCISSQGSSYTLCADGCCVTLLFPHWDLGYITCVWATLFQALLTSVLNLLLTHPRPRTIISNQTSFLKQMTPTISNISEKEMQEDQCAFLFPGGWLLLVSLDATRLEPGPSEGLLLLSVYFSSGTFGTSRTFCTEECPVLLAVVTDNWRFLHFKCTRTHPGQFTEHLSTLDKTTWFWGKAWQQQLH